MMIRYRPIIPALPPKASIELIRGVSDDYNTDYKIINDGAFKITSSTLGIDSDKLIINSNGDTSLNGTINATGYFINGAAFAGGAAGAPGKGFKTGSAYNASTGIVSFLSDDGLGFTTTDIRGVSGKGFKTGSVYNASTGVVSFLSDDGLGFNTGDLRGSAATSFWTNTNTNDIYYNLTGKVGVGINNPASKLHIYDNTIATTAVTIQNNFTGTSITSSPSATTTGTTGIYTYMVFTYTTDNTGAGQTQYTVSVPPGGVGCDILMVGGGGAGGKDLGSGGGGVAVLYGTNISRGSNLHIDNLLRCDATVFTVGVGRDVVYDMAQVLDSNPREGPTILRSSNPEGTMMVLDGESRYKWAHGIPCSTQSKGGRDSVKKQTKYTLILRLLHHEELSREIGICKEIGTKMYTMTS
jgi:hypothetical protein